MRGAHNGRMRRRDSQEFGVKCLSKRRPGGGEGDYLNVGVILKWVNGYQSRAVGHQRTRRGFLASTCRDSSLYTRKSVRVGGGYCNSTK